MKKIIFFSEIPWNFLYQRHHVLADKFADLSYQVIFVERIIGRVPSFREIYTLIKKRFSKNDKSVVYPKRNPGIIYKRSLFLPNTNPIFRLCNSVYWKTAFSDMCRSSILYSFSDNPFVFGNSSNINRKVASLTVFDVVHNFPDFPWNKELRRKQFFKMVEIADKVVTDSDPIFNVIQSSHKLLMYPGVNEYWFDGGGAQEVKQRKHGRIKILFYGNLRSNNDLELLNELHCEDNIDLDLYGLIDKTAADQIDGLNYLGSVSNRDLPEIIKNYDAVVLPYNEETFSKTISPAKYFESLATGKLILSCSALDHLPGWNECVVNLDLGKNLYDQIRTSMETQAERAVIQLDIAKKNTWERRFEELLDFLEINDREI